MKVIKQIKKQTLEFKLRKFFLQMPFVAKAIIFLYCFIGLVLLLVPSSQNYSVSTFFSMRFTEIILLIVVGLNDLKRQEGNGSFYMMITFLIKNILILIVQYVLQVLIRNWPIFQVLTCTAIVIQYLFWIMVQNTFIQSNQRRYIFIQPFQIKAKFYPLFFYVLLTLFGLRIDLIVPFVLAVIFHFVKLKHCVSYISSKLDIWFLTESLIAKGFLKTGGLVRQVKNIDQLATNDSIMF